MNKRFKSIYERLNNLPTKYRKLKYFVKELPGDALMVMLQGGFGTCNPNKYMDDVAKFIVGKWLHNQFIKSSLDYPWMRIIVFRFNDIAFKSVK